MKTIFSWILGHIAPIRRHSYDVVGEGQVSAAIGVIAEQLGTEAIKVGARRCYIVDRIPRKGCHQRRIEPHHAAATTSCRARDAPIGGWRVPRGRSGR